MILFQSTYAGCPWGVRYGAAGRVPRPQVAMPSGGLHCLPRIYHNNKISIHAPIRERLSLPEGNLS